MSLFLFKKFTSNVLIFGLCSFGAYLTFIDKPEAGMAAIGVGVSIATIKQDEKQDENSFLKKENAELRQINHLHEKEKIELNARIEIEKQALMIEFKDNEIKELKAQLNPSNSPQISFKLPSDSLLKLHQQEENNNKDLDP